MNLSTKPSASKLLTCVFLLIFSSLSYCYAQMDTLVTNNQRIACSVKEITPDAVKYSYPGEDVINTVYKNTVQKIIFKSGRVQSFAEATSFKKVSGVMDFDNVTITSTEDEVRGLFKITDVDSKAKGTTVFSSQERVKDRAYRKIKIQAAMFGANIIYLTNQRQEGNKYGSYYTSGSTTETNLTGVAYSNVLPDYNTFKKLIGDKANFIAVRKYQLGASDADVSQDNISDEFVITNISNNNGIVVIEGNLRGERRLVSFQLAYINQNSFNIATNYKGTAYNFEISLQ